MDHIAADFLALAPVANSVIGNCSDTDNRGSPGAGILDIDLGTLGILHHQGSGGGGVGQNLTIGLGHFDLIAGGVLHFLPADLEPVSQRCHRCGMVETGFGDGGNTQFGSFGFRGNGGIGGDSGITGDEIVPPVPPTGPGSGRGGAVVGIGGNSQGEEGCQNQSDRDNFLHNKFLLYLF